MKWKTGFWIVVVALLSWYLRFHGKIEQDIVSSLERSRPEEAAIFHQIQGSGFFQDQIYIMPEPGVESVDDLKSVLEKSGYKLTNAFEPKLDDPRQLYALLPYLPQNRLEYLLGPEYRATLQKQMSEWIQTPGGLGMLRLVERDPLLLTREIPALFQKGLTTSKPLVAKREGDIDWEKTRELYSYLTLHSKDFRFLGGDFFALENYDAVHHDIWLCTLLSTLLSLFIFRYFCRQWSLLLFLIAGTAISAICALFVTGLWFGAVYGLVLAFASTFVSFNNETLVHLAGVDWTRDVRSRIGIFSALGTTILGFFVLLFSSSYLTQQLAVLSLVSLLAFLAFLLTFRTKLESFHFREVTLPAFALRPAALYSSFGFILLAIFLLPKPAVKTNLEEFRYASPFLMEQTNRFTQQVKSLSLEQLHAVPKDRLGEVQSLIDSEQFHPLQLFSKDKPTVDLSKTFELISTDLKAAGVNLVLNPADFTASSLSRKDYLNLWQTIWPLPWETENHLLVFLKPGASVSDAIPMHPRTFYEHILSELSSNLFYLFLIGLALMLLYLIPWQRNLLKVIVIFLPLAFATLCLQIIFWQSGRNLTILHIMGLALVIAVALDYGAVLVSSDHGAAEQGKVLLTGALTLSSFGSLLFATHPVLKELALIVFIGTLVAWIMALFIQIHKQEIT